MYKQSDIKEVHYINYDLFEVKWFVTEWCNYRCSYCCQGPKEDRKWNSEAEVCEAAKNFNTLITKNKISKPLSLQLLGGEVCFYDWTTILEHINNITKVFITTNFSNKLEYFKKLYNYCYNRKIRLQLLCSYHNSGDEFFKKFLDLSHWCIENNYRVPRLTFVVDNNFNFEFIEKYPELSNNKIEFCNKQLPDGSCVKLNKEISERIKQINALPHPWMRVNDGLAISDGKWEFTINTEKVLDKVSNIFRDLEYNRLLIGRAHCDAGINSISIKPDGELTRCTNNFRSLGNLFTNTDIKLTSDICEYTECFLCHPVNIIKIED